MRILIATNQLKNIAGSEVVCFELARYFQSLGHTIDVYASRVGPPMHTLFRERLGVAVSSDPDRIVPLQYDFVYFQHQVSALFRYDPTGEDAPATTIVYGRLSRRSFLESGGWMHDNVLGDHTIANSELTAEWLRETGIAHPVSVFFNAAPAGFAAAPRKLPTTPATILVVSNHDDPSLRDAVRRLRRVAKVEWVGLFGDAVRLVDPAMIGAADLVITIGKSVQYALLAHTPVYVYDHFGGPGYLTDDNFDRTARYSFSGRCCETRRSGQELVGDILTGYTRGRTFAEAENATRLARFRLEPHLDRLLLLPPTSNAERRRRMEERADALARERLLADYVRQAETRPPGGGCRARAVSAARRSLAAISALGGIIRR